MGNELAQETVKSILVGLGLSQAWVPLAAVVALLLVDVGLVDVCTYRHEHPEDGHVSFSDLFQRPSTATPA
jgi:hypothetical protein